jgi:hypothetical protein
MLPTNKSKCSKREERKRSFIIRTLNMFRPRQRKKHTHASDKLFLQDSGIGRRESGALGDVSTLSGIWPGLRR